jgi:hypothetical protein
MKLDYPTDITRSAHPTRQQISGRCSGTTAWTRAALPHVGDHPSICTREIMESGKGEDVRAKHFEYYLRDHKAGETEYYSPKELEWLVWLEHEWDNLRAAVEWSVANRPQAGLELVNAWVNFSWTICTSTTWKTGYRNWFHIPRIQPGQPRGQRVVILGAMHRHWFESAGYFIGTGNAGGRAIHLQRSG